MKIEIGQQYEVLINGESRWVEVVWILLRAADTDAGQEAEYSIRDVLTDKPLPPVTAKVLGGVDDPRIVGEPIKWADSPAGKRAAIESERHEKEQYEQMLERRDVIRRNIAAYPYAAVYDKYGQFCEAETIDAILDAEKYGISYKDAIKACRAK